MSFGDIGGVVPGIYIGNGGSVRGIAGELRGHVAALRANSGALRRSSVQLREAFSEAELRKVRALRAQNRELAGNAAALAGRLDALAGGDHKGAKDAEDMHALLKGALQDFSSALRESVEREKDALQKERAAANEKMGNGVDVAGIRNGRTPGREGRETDPLLVRGDVQERMQINSSREAMARELRSNDEFRSERDSALREMQSSVDDVNSIMQDLAVMIGEQGSQLEYVEVNVGNAAEKVCQARRELAKAQARREKKKQFFFGTLLAIAAIVALLLIIVLS